VVWKHPAGQAFSQLAVQGDAAYTTLSDEEKSYAVRLDAGTGEEVWRRDLGEVFTEQMGNGPRATPTLEGDRVYVPSARGVLHALSATDGAVIWSVDLKEKFGTPQPRFGFSPSPLIVGDLLILEAGGKEEEKAIVALDKGTSEVRWSGLTGTGGYSSPILAGFGGVDQIVLPRGKTVTALSLEGEVLWTFDMEEGVIAMPVLVGEDKLFVSASGDTGCALIRITRGEDGFHAESIWKNRSIRNHFNSSVARGGFVYGFDNATLKCVSLEDGEVQWGKRGFGKGSLIAVGDQLLVLSDKGKLILVEATPEEYRETGAYQAMEGKSWTAPSYADGRVYLRNLNEMICLDVRG
jgi:outer membrane protein assembly factor BamB